MKRLSITLILLLALLGLRELPTLAKLMNPRLFTGTVLEATYTPTPVKSIQMVSIALAGATSNTATLSPAVTAANSILIYSGHSNSESSGFTHGDGWIRGAFTNGTTITANAGIVATGTYTASVVEFLPQFVKSSGCGTLTVGATATITAVTLAKTMLVTTGYSNTYNTASSAGVNGATAGAKFNSTTQIGVNATADNGGLTLGYCYLEFK